MKELYGFFRAEDIEEVNLKYVLGNREAKRFWRSLGFKEKPQAPDLDENSREISKPR